MSRRTTTHSAATMYESAAVSLHDLRPDLAWAPLPGQLVALDWRIKPLWVGAAVSGPAFTVQGAGGDNLALHRAVYAAPVGSVLVVDANGAPFGHWGEVLAVAAQTRGIAGLVIDGAVRDAREMSDLGFPVFSRGTSVRSTRKLVVGELGTHVKVGDVLVQTGDLIVADADGVVAIPAEVVGDVIAGADARVRQEKDVFEQLRNGATTLEIYQLGR